MSMNLKQTIVEQFNKAEDKYEFLNEVRTILYELSPEKVNPVDRVLWIPKEKIVANNYNPNHVANKEMQLLYTSVREDGYTMPIVTIWDESLQKYVIIDGFHRNLVIRKFKDIDERCNGRLPIVVLDKDIDQRMASTIRHNRARGSHSVDGTVNIVFKMLKDGKSEREICEKLGFEQKEFQKFKYITGFARIFKDYSYSKEVVKVVDEKRLAREGGANENNEG